MVYDNTPKVEFNSNVAVLQRLDKIINKINDARFDKDPLSMIEAVIALYKEVSVELSKTEKTLWDNVVLVRNKVISLPTNPEAIQGTFLNVDQVLFDLDVLDLELRGLAKKHGFLSANKEDPRSSVMQRG